MEYLESLGFQWTEDNIGPCTLPTPALWELPSETFRPGVLQSSLVSSVCGHPGERQRVGSPELRFHGQMNWLGGQESEGFGLLPLAAIHTLDSRKQWAVCEPSVEGAISWWRRTV